MKILLACLMCCVLTASQCFAIKGGPDYGGSGSLVGTYAGVMEGEMGSNGLGIFTVGVPQTGLASGVFIVFQEGLFFNGTMQAVADGTKKKITGLLHAEATRVEIIDDGVNIVIAAVADGQMIATVTANNNFFSARLLAGTALVSVHDRTNGLPDDVQPQQFQVSGFQQSGTPPSG